jgi:hypothetical protein
MKQVKSVYIDILQKLYIKRVPPKAAAELLCFSYQTARNYYDVFTTMGVVQEDIVDYLSPGQREYIKQLHGIEEVSA